MNQTHIIGSRLLISLAALMVIVAGLKAAQSILIPILFALFLAILGTPLVTALHRRKIPKLLAVALVAGIIVAVLVALGTGLARSVNEFTSAAPRYTARFAQIVQDLEVLVAAHFDLEFSSAVFFESITPNSIMDLIATTLRRLVSALSSTLMVIVVLLFMLFEAAGFQAKLKAAMAEAYDGERFKQITRDVQRYLYIKTGTSILTGTIVLGLNTFFGVEFALLWGLLAFLMNYIPVIGSILAAIPAIILALVQFGVPSAVGIAIGYVIVNVGISNFLEPVMMGRRLGLSPLIIFLSLVVWGWIWGPAGMLLSVPLTMVVKILLEHSVEFHPIAILMDSRPAEAAQAVAERHEASG
jgi:AI-2 transport protein TqsA